jgi:hypothetical protein
MNVDVRIQSDDLEAALTDYVIRRLHFSLGRFAGRLGRVVVRVSDLNGPRGGVDKACRILAEFTPSGKTVLNEAVDANLFVAIDRATERIGRNFSRRLERERELWSGRESVRTETIFRS